MALETRQKKILFIAITIVACIIFLGIKFHKPKQIPITLEAWGILDESETFLSIIENYQKKYPYIKINYTLKNETTYHDEILKAFSDNQAPDIFIIKRSYLPYYENKIFPLNLKKDKDLNLFDLNQTYPNIVKNALIKDDYLFGIPLYIDSLALYYNQDIFNYYNIALPPATWEEVLNLVSNLRRTNAQGQITRAAIALGSSSNIHWGFDIISTLMMQYGSNIVNTDKKQTTFNSKINYGDTIDLVVSQNSKYPEECWKFLKFLAEKNTAEFYYLQTKNPPARLDLIQNYLNEPVTGIFTRQILLSQNWYQYNFQEMNQIFKEMVEDITLRGKSPAQAIITASDRINFFWNKK